MGDGMDTSNGEKMAGPLAKFIRNAGTDGRQAGYQILVFTAIDRRFLSQ